MAQVLGEPRSLRFAMIGTAIVILMESLVDAGDFLGFFLDGLLKLDSCLIRAKLAKTVTKDLTCALSQFDVAFFVSL